MPDFSVIMQDSTTRALVQENLLQAEFHDALFPEQLFRSSVTPVLWPAQQGDTHVFSRKGPMTPQMRPLIPGQDPVPQTFGYEQWTSQLQTYSQTIDTHMPSSAVAAASLFMANAHQLGLVAGQTLNRLARNKLYNAAESGWTVADGVQTSTSTLRVKRLNGFTRARTQNTQGNVRYDFVSSTNPLAIKVFDNGAEASFNVIGFTPDNPGDEIGPGTLTLNSAVTNVADRAYVFSFDRTYMVRVGGGTRVDDVGNTDIANLAMLRSMVTRARQMNIPRMPDGTYHVHIDPTIEAQLYGDPEFQRLNRGLPDGHMYRDFSIGEILGCTLIRNTEGPQVDTVVGGLTGNFTLDDPFAGELYNNGNASTGIQIHRAVLTGSEGVTEAYWDYGALLTEAGMTGTETSGVITNNGIEINTDRIQFMVRAPLNRLQDMVASTYRFMGDFVVGSDSLTGDSARYKRMVVGMSGS